MEFKNRNETKTNDKQIQVDINYLPIESYPRVDEKFHVDLASKNAGKFRDIDAQVPTFYVLDDVFGDHFKRRSMIKRTNRREVLFRSGMILKFQNHLNDFYTSLKCLSVCVCVLSNL